MRNSLLALTLIAVGAFALTGVGSVPAIASIVEISSLSGSTETLNFNSFSHGSDSSVTVGGDTFANTTASSPASSVFIDNSCGSSCGITTSGITKFLETDNGLASFTTPDKLTITPAAGVTEIGLTYGTFDFGNFTPTSISATVTATGGGTATFSLSNSADTEQFVGLSSNVALTSIVLSGVAPCQVSGDRCFAQSGEIDLIEVTQNTVSSTPLPAALPLFAGGLGLMGLLTKRRKQKSAIAFIGAA